MSECVVCEKEIENKGWCPRCELFADALVGPGVSGRPTQSERAELEELLGTDRGRTNETRWRSLLAAHADSEDVRWFKRRGIVPTLFDADSIDDNAFALEDEVIENGLQFLRQRLAGRARPEPKETRRLLQRGIPLPDGGWLNCVNYIWSLNGEIIPGKLPYRHILRALTGTEKEKRQLRDFDFYLLLGVIGTLSMPRNRAHLRRRRYQMARRWREVPLFHRGHWEANVPLEGTTLFFSWLEWIDDFLRSRLAEGERPPNWMQGAVGPWAHFRDRGRYRNENPPEVPWTALAELEMPWVDRWHSETNGGTEWRPAEQWSGPALVVNHGRLFLRMLRGGIWKKVPLPPWPELWALLLSWQLSPPEHPAHRRLRTLQWIWDDPEGELVPSEQDCRALGLLHSVCEANDRCEYQEKSPAPGLIVEGTSGLFYHVQCGRGPHSARFRVYGCTSMEQANQGEGTPICIREGPGVGSLPAGDVITSVVLALMDDMRAQTNLPPLAEFIGTNQPRENQQEENRFQFQNPFINRRHIVGRQRWTWAFPGLYEVLIRLPLASAMLLPQEQRGQLLFVDNRFSMIIRDEEERELVEGLARSTGWRPQGEDGGQIRWLRNDVPFEQVRHWLVELLGPFQRRHGQRGDPPWWTLYREPFPHANLPDRIPDALNRPFADDPEDLFDAA